jgi:hypothetical protein
MSASNVATQSVNPADIGMPKADALAKDIVACNPASAVVAIHGRIEDISDLDFHQLITGPLRAERTSTKPGFAAFVRAHQPKKVKAVILLVLTDNFEAQARGHRLRGAEITFTVPGVTPACHRCITASRYRAYLSKGYRNTVTSHGAPIFSAEMLNAALGFVLLGVAHYGSGHPRFGKIVKRLGDRNLLLLRMDPNFDAFLGRPAFSRRLAGASQPDAFFMMDTLFLKQTPDTG